MLPAKPQARIARGRRTANLASRKREQNWTDAPPTRPYNPTDAKPYASCATDTQAMEVDARVDIVQPTTSRYNLRPRKQPKN